MKVQLLAAIAVAGFHRLLTEAKRLRIALRTPPAPEVPPETILRRLQYCRVNCRLFFAPLQTCDSPFRSDKWPNGVEEGCFCHMPSKARLKCNCPLYDRSGGIEGWPTELNSFPHESPQG